MSSLLATTRPAAPVQAPSKDSVVMFVDDDPRVLEGIRRSLRNQPYRIVTARSGDEALHVLKSRSIDVIVCDEHMPGTHGIEVMNWAARECPDVIRIMLTGMPSVPLAVRAVNECKLHRFITKPCKEMELAMAIEEGLAHRRLVRENKELLRLTQEQLSHLERAHRELDRFARTLVHDMCQPLQSILLHCEMAGEARSAATDEGSEHMRSATRSVERMISLIKALGAYAALDTVEVPQGEVDLHDVIGAVEQDLSAAILETRTTVSAEALPVVFGHAPLLRQLFQNLVHNALKYRGNRTISIHVSSEPSADGGTRVFVADNGPGLPSGETGGLFEALQRGANSRNVPGTGLGLATCRKIMEMHGGEISLRPGDSGATFVLTFPPPNVKPPPVAVSATDTQYRAEPNGEIVTAAAGGGAIR
jgi:signal transduction histidine kinase